MLEFKKICKENFIKYKKIVGNNSANSESSIVNMHIWSHYYNAQYCAENDVLYSIYNLYGQNLHAFMPYGKERNSEYAVDLLLQYFKSIGAKLVIDLATEDFKDFVVQCGKYKVTVLECENSFDYLYHTADLIHLSGKKYHSKKNHLNAFNKKYNYEYVKYNEALKNDCIDFCWKVLSQKHFRKLNLFSAEYLSIEKAFEDFDVLDLVGAVITIDEKIVALTVGERLNPTTALIHIEKADPNYNDAFAVINNLFLQKEFADTNYVNREEDMGIEGLRKAKQSYHPCDMIKKYTIRFE